METRRLIFSLFAAALFFPSGVSAENSSDPYPFHEGTRWVYQTADKTEKAVLVAGHTMFKTGAGPLHAATLRREDGSDRLIFRSKENWYDCAATKQSEERASCDLHLLFFRWPLKEGDQWQSAGIHFAVISQESVDTPLKNFSNAWKIAYTMAGAGDPLGEIWIAEGYGRVRILEKETDYRLARFELGKGNPLPATADAIVEHFTGAPPETSIKPHQKPTITDYLPRLDHRWLYFLLIQAILIVPILILGFGLLSALKKRQVESPLPGDEAPSEEGKLLAAVARGGDVRKAREGLEELVVKHPNYADLRYQLALVCRTDSDFEQAKDNFSKALRLNPKYTDAKLGLANLLLAMEEPEAAAKEFKEVTVSHPTYADAHLGLGTALLTLGKKEKAEAALQEALRINSHLAEAERLLSECRNSAQKLESESDLPREEK